MKKDIAYIYESFLYDRFSLALAIPTIAFLFAYDKTWCCLYLGYFSKNKNVGVVYLNSVDRPLQVSNRMGKHT